MRKTPLTTRPSFLSYGYEAEMTVLFSRIEIGLPELFYGALAKKDTILSRLVLRVNEILLGSLLDMDVENH